MGCFLTLLMGMDLIAKAQSTEPSTPVIAVDNADRSYVTVQGSWQSASDPASWSFDFVHDGNIYKGSKEYAFAPEITIPGSYEVWIRYPSGPDRASNVPIDVVHATGTTTYTVNQRLNGGTWIKLGVHSFRTGNAGKVVIRTTGTDGLVCADAVKWVLTDIPIITVTATDPVAVEPVEPTRAWDYGTFTLTRTGSTDLPLTVDFWMSGSASIGFDYEYLGLITIPAGASKLAVALKPLPDLSPEWPAETATMQLLPRPAYRISSPASATVEIVDNDWEPYLTVDNADNVGRVVPVGSWASSTSYPGYWGKNYLHDQNTGKGSKSFALYPYVPSRGRYEVFTRHTADANRASNVPVDIYCADGLKTVTVNQRINHATWVSLGIYTFDFGNTDKIVMRTTGTDGYVIVDAVRLVPIPDTYVEVSNYVPLAAEPSVASSFQFRRSGDLRAPLQVLFYLSGSATAGVDYIDPGQSIVIPAGASTVDLKITPIDDLQPESQEDIVLNLRRSSEYSISGQQSATMYLGDNDPRSYLKVDNADGPQRVVASAGWASSSLTAGFQGINYLHDGNSGKGTKSVEFIPTVPFTDVYDVYIQYPAAPNRASNVPVEIRHANGTTTVKVDQRINGGMWFKLGTFTFAGGISNRVIVRNTGTDGYAIADAVLLDRPLWMGLSSESAASRIPQLSVDAATGVTVAFPSEAGRGYLLEASTNLIDWFRVANGLGGGPTSRLLDPAGGQDAHRFYRVLEDHPVSGGAENR
ncbi:MAG: hypothetical protein IT581_12505 [Verrucomicrobiales bacterium]|nr:hypothetical protein [Verrucomicrobiales bacterium]